MRVVVFALHSCPVSALGPYGNEWVGTPHLDRLAAAGVVFDRHISDCPDPAAARKQWGSGVLTPPLLHSSTPPLLTSRGVRTVLVNHARPANDPPADFRVGWDDVVVARPDPADPSPMDALVRALPGVLDRLAAVPDWLVWVEIDRPVPPWHVPQDVFEAYLDDLADDPADEPDPAEFAPPTDEGDESLEDLPDLPDLPADDPEPPPPDPGPDADDPDEEPDPPDDEPDADDPDDDGDPVRPWADPPAGAFDRDDLAAWELLHRSYAAAVTAFDADLGEVFDLLTARGLDRTAAWVVTADRGFPLGEHGWVGSGRPDLYEELVHVPLIVRLPGGAEAGRRVAGLTQPADVAATLADWFGAGPPAGAAGRSLVPLLAGTAGAVRDRAVSGLDGGWAVRTPDWVLIRPGDPGREPMLFRLPDDRGEVNDVRQHHPDAADELGRDLPAGGVEGGEKAPPGPPD